METQSLSFQMKKTLNESQMKTKMCLKITSKSLRGVTWTIFGRPMALEFPTFRWSLAMKTSKPQTTSKSTITVMLKKMMILNSLVVKALRKSRSTSRRRRSMIALPKITIAKLSVQMRKKKNTCLKLTGPQYGRKSLKAISRPLKIWQLRITRQVFPLQF